MTGKKIAKGQYGYIKKQKLWVTVRTVCLYALSEKTMEIISKHAAGLTEVYDMFFTSYEKNYSVSHMVIKNNVVCGYTENSKTDCTACETHVDSYLKKGGCHGVAVKIFNDIEKYCESLQNLKKQEETDNTQTMAILENLLAISL